MKRVLKVLGVLISCIIILSMTQLEVLAVDGFDAAYYASKYPDVVQAYGNDPTALLNHYNTFGIKEGRFKNQNEELSNSEFDATYYAAKYPDVVAVLGNDPKILLNHYLNYGIKEGRYKNKIEELAGKPAEYIKTADITTEIIPVYSTYVDVDIAGQTVTYFEDGVSKFQSPCVTGSPYYKGGTPTGTFSIIEKIPGKRLVGPTWDCWVNRWMKFTYSSCGFHDASWRSEFGGDIYTHNGSHGCVNLPKDAAYTLYDMISVGTTVVVH